MTMRRASVGRGSVYLREIRLSVEAPEIFDLVSVSGAREKVSTVTSRCTLDLSLLIADTQVAMRLQSAALDMDVSELLGLLYLASRQGSVGVFPTLEDLDGVFEESFREALGSKSVGAGPSDPEPSRELDRVFRLRKPPVDK